MRGLGSSRHLRVPQSPSESSGSPWEVAALHAGLCESGEWHLELHGVRRIFWSAADGDSKQEIDWINKYWWFIDVYLLSIDIYGILKGLINKASFFHRCDQCNGDFTTKLGIDMSTSAPATSKIDMKTLVNLGYSNHGHWQWGILSFFNGRIISMKSEGHFPGLRSALRGQERPGILQHPSGNQRRKA